MLNYFDLRKGAEFVLDGDPYEVLEFQQIFKAQDVVTARTKIKNLISGKVIEKTFHKGDTFEEADLVKIDAKFIYESRGKYVFAKPNNPSERFELTEDQIGYGCKFLK
jgi:elongation factor P